MADWLHCYDVKVHESPKSELSQRLRLEEAPLEGKYVMFVSGLSLGSTDSSAVHDVAVQLLMDFMGGRFGDRQYSQLASRIVRMIIAGNSVVPADASAVKER